MPQEGNNFIAVNDYVDTGGQQLFCHRLDEEAATLKVVESMRMENISRVKYIIKSYSPG